MRRLLIGLGLVLSLAAPAAAQQRVDRFPAEEPARDTVTADIDRDSYWLEGAALGLAFGVASAFIAVEPARAGCSDVEPFGCEDSGPGRLVAVPLSAVLGSFAGSIIGASIDRE